MTNTTAVPVTLVPHTDHGQELYEQAATFDLTPWLETIQANYPEEFAGWVEDGMPTGEFTEGALDAIVNGPEGHEADRFASALATLGFSYFVRFNEADVAAWAAAHRPAHRPALTGKARDAAVQAIHRLTGLSKPAACTVVDELHLTHVGTHYRQAVNAIIKDCADGTVALATVAPLMMACGADRTATFPWQVEFRIDGRVFRVSTFDTLTAILPDGPKDIPTGIPASGMGNPLYVARKLMTAAKNSI